MNEIPLIARKPRGQTYEYTVCKQGVFMLKKLKSKKLRIIFNITHKKKTLNTFNHWILNELPQNQQQIEPTACLTINTNKKQLSQDRVIIILTAYQCCQKEPLMIVLGYLIASVFIYHHFDSVPAQDRPLTTLLNKLYDILKETNVDLLTSQLSYSKGYASSPYFLCLFSSKHSSDLFQEVYRIKQGNEQMHNAVQTLIDYFPLRKAFYTNIDMESIYQIGNQFETDIVGRTVFNFQFTGGTLQNLCFDCCQTFNSQKVINLNECYEKIIKNQKARLQGQSIQHFMHELSSTFFFGGKVDFQGQSSLPTSAYQLLNNYKKISDIVLQTSLQSATSCMTLTQFRKLQVSLRKYFNQKLSQIQDSNAQHADSLCTECYGILDNLSQIQFNPDNLITLIQQIQNNLDLFSSECQVLIKGDQIQKLIWQYHSRLCSNYFGQLQTAAREVVDDLILKDQENRTQIEDLKYDIRLKQNQLRNLQYQYQLQGEILNQTKCKLLYQDNNQEPQVYTFQANKLRRKLQELEQQVKDKTLHVEELQELIEHYEGTKQKERSKFRFSKEIQDLMKDVSQKVNSYYNVVRQTKQVNELEQQIRHKFSKEKSQIVEQQRQSKRQIAVKQSQLQRLKSEKTVLEQGLQQNKSAIDTLKQASMVNKRTANQLQKTYTQLNCRLADTEIQLQYYRKAILLAGEQVSKGGKSQKLIKFCNTAKNKQLTDLLSPFLKK